MMMLEDIKKDFNNSLKEIQDNTAKELQVLKEKQENKTKQVEVLKEKQENTSKLVMEMNETILDIKSKVDIIKKTQNEATLEIETLSSGCFLFSMIFSFLAIFHVLQWTFLNFPPFAVFLAIFSS